MNIDFISLPKIPSAFSPVKSYVSVTANILYSSMHVLLDTSRHTISYEK